MNKPLKDKHMPDAVLLCSFPQNFRLATGFSTPGKYFALWWTNDGRDLAGTDGIVWLYGLKQEPMLELLESKLDTELDRIICNTSFPAGKPPYDLIGGAGNEAFNWLLFDIEGQECYLAPRNQVQAFLTPANDFQLIDMVSVVSVDNATVDYVSMVKSDHLAHMTLRHLMSLAIATAAPEMKQQETHGRWDAVVCEKCHYIGWVLDADKYAWNVCEECGGRGGLVKTDSNSAQDAPEPGQTKPESTDS